MNIYNSITPTYLYVKQHSITGMKYFGKTTRNPIKYIGSGKYWKRHISKHGKLQKTRKINPVYDHMGNIFDNPRRMAKFYSLTDNFYSKLDIPIRYSSVYEKLNIPYTEENRKKTKRELGFKFQEKSI